AKLVAVAVHQATLFVDPTRAESRGGHLLDHVPGVAGGRFGDRFERGVRGGDEGCLPAQGAVVERVEGRADLEAVDPGVRGDGQDGPVQAATAGGRVRDGGGADQCAVHVD